MRSAPGHKVKVAGALAPKVKGSDARLQLWAAHPGKALHQVASAKLTAGAKKYDRTFALGSGSWNVKVRYVNKGVVKAGSSATKHVQVS